jgi:hypothetical protein
VTRTSLIFCLLAFTATNLFPQQIDFPTLKGPYLGQKPPGMTPEIFAPGIVSTENRVYANVTFSPDLTEVCWTPNAADSTFYHGGIITSKFEDGLWTIPKEIRFLGEDYSHRSPFYSLDGKRLYFQAYLRNHQGWDQKEKFYYVEKTSNGWSKPVLLDTIFNKYAVHWQFSLDSNNNLYFGGDLRGRENTGGIYFSKYQNGKYLKPVLIFENSVLDEAVFGPAISPKGDYILFARIHPRGSTNPRIFSIYLSFRKSENDWTQPKDLGEILNMDGNQPRISPYGKYIFYVGNDGMSYWVDAKIIEELKAKE